MIEEQRNASSILTKYMFYISVNLLKFFIPYSQQEQLYHGYRGRIKMHQLMLILMTIHGLNAMVS